MSKKTKKTQLSDKELKLKYKKWLKNFIKGVDEILDLPSGQQQYLWFCMLNECLYTQESNPFLAQMYKSDGLYDVDDAEPLEDYQLVPMNRARLIEGMKTFLMNGGKKKWTDTLRIINESADKEDY